MKLSMNVIFDEIYQLKKKFTIDDVTNFDDTNDFNFNSH